jgi:uncharacterized protein (UPF0332 family)
MTFDAEWHEEKFKELLKKADKAKFYIRESQEEFKIKLYQRKGEQSFMIASFLTNAAGNKKIREDNKLPDALFLNYWIITVSYYCMLYLAKAIIMAKGYETDDHFSTQIALGKLFVITDELEREDLEILNQSYRILEDEYVAYFEEARKESRTARYAAIKSYEEERVKTIYENAKKFIAKLSLIIEKNA